MSSAAHSYPFHLRAGAIKRVVRRGGTFLCGLCRSTYPDETHAVGCLSHCWGELLRLDPVLPRRRGRAAVTFRCRFCARDFVRRMDAHACAIDCRDREHKKHVDELAMLASDDVTPAPRHHFKRRAPAQAMIILPPKKKAAKAPADGPKVEALAAPSPAGPAVGSVAAAPAEAAAPVEAAAEAPKKPKGDKAFIRDGAEYVCTYCNNRFFTKLEVTKCFEAH